MSELTDKSKRDIEGLLTQVLEKYGELLSKDLILDILNSHGNFAFATKFSLMRMNYQSVIENHYYMLNFKECVSGLKTYLTRLAKGHKEIQNFANEQKALSGLLAKFGWRLSLQQFDDFFVLLCDLLKHENLKLFSDEFYIQGFSFLSSGKAFQGIDKLLSQLVG